MQAGAVEAARETLEVHYRAIAQVRPLSWPREIGDILSWKEEGGGIPLSIVLTPPQRDPPPPLAHPPAL